MAQLLLKTTLDFSSVRARDIPLFFLPTALIIGIEDGNVAEILDAAYLIQYPFVNSFGFVKGDYFRLSSGFNLIRFDVRLQSKFRLLPLRKQSQITLSIWDVAMPFSSDPNAQSSTSGTTTTFAASITSAAILPANPNRKGLLVVNNAAAAILYIGYGATVTPTTFAVKVSPGQSWESQQDYDGPLSGVWSAALGSAQVTEYV
ncbi:MAG: hypothetical protein KME45_11545 [Stenomitos rutilans HA7619-LM2]|jgi:hypothetical protein|nr:hypothetical protein [Stenomitos rutilans HA7619-LM2]